PESRGGQSPDGRRVKGTLQWVSVEHGVDAEIRLYDNLFSSENPEEDGSFIDNLNPESLTVLKNCKLEPSLADAKPGEPIQFMRHGYFCVDSVEDSLVFNRTVSLKDSWARMQKNKG
ncbi:MAG: glutamine--tRNA ligase, partial [bacterium]|nr:glutamine--tRNA ligase [bacterium]